MNDTNDKTVFGYEKPFRYNADWYANIYHHVRKDEELADPGPGQYEDRDTECMLAMGIKENDSILIPGCGGGNNISLLKKTYNNLSIVGFDWSETALGFCRSVFPDIPFFRSSVEGLSLGDETFDHIMAFDFTEHLSLVDYVLFLKKTFCLLRPGGTIGVLPGMTIRPEHINLIFPLAIACHLKQMGFDIVTGGKQWIVGGKP